MIIGSTAMRHWYPDFPREPGDLDLWEDSAVPNSRAREAHWCPAFATVIDRYRYHPYAPPELLYTIKVSHAPWSTIHFDKTVFDIRFLQSKGAQIDEEAYKLLYAHWETLFGKKRAYLAKDNHAFFEDGVKRRYVHDDLHRAVAFYYAPLFERLKPDLASAMCFKSLFFALSRADQVKCIQEEAFVVALERFLIPNDFTMSSYGAYREALKLLATSMTKGWFARAIFERWSELVVKPIDFVALFEKNRHAVRELT